MRPAQAVSSGPRRRGRGGSRSRGRRRPSRPIRATDFRERRQGRPRVATPAKFMASRGRGFAGPRRPSAVPRRVPGVVGAHQDVGGGGRVGLGPVALEGGEGPVLVLRGAAAQGARGEEDVDGQVEGEPVAQEEGTVRSRMRAGRELDVGAAGGAVGGGVPQVGQDPARAAGFERAEDLAPERGRCRTSRRSRPPRPRGRTRTGARRAAGSPRCRRRARTGRVCAVPPTRGRRGRPGGRPGRRRRRRAARAQPSSGFRSRRRSARRSASRSQVIASSRTRPMMPRATDEARAGREAGPEHHVAMWPPGGMNRVWQRCTTPPPRTGLVVVQPLRKKHCAECRSGPLALLVLEEGAPRCLDCADLGHLVFLPRGDTALTRRAAGGECAVGRGRTVQPAPEPVRAAGRPGRGGGARPRRGAMPGGRGGATAAPGSGRAATGGGGPAVHGRVRRGDTTAVPRRARRSGPGRSPPTRRCAAAAASAAARRGAP